MFSNLILYSIAECFTFDLADREASLAARPFTPCGPTQERAFGWVPPRGETHGAMLESIGGHWIAKAMTETKAVPAAVLTKRAY